MWVVMRLHKFERAIDVPFPFHARWEMGKLKGFLPVYKTEEDALVDYPNEPMMEIEEVRNEKDESRHGQSN